MTYNSIKTTLDDKCCKKGIITMEKKQKGFKWSYFIWVILPVCAVVTLTYILYDANRVKPENPLYGGDEEHDWQGDHVYLGSYEQDGNVENGKEPILWRVLNIDGNEMILLSEYALDVRAFHPVSQEVTWEISEVRRWLNDEFFEEALSDRGSFKQSYVLETECSASDNQRYGTDGGNDTVDKVFLLSWEDTYNESYGFPKAFTRMSEYLNQEMKYSEVSKARLCYPTIYASKKDPLITRNNDIHEDPFDIEVNGYGSVYWLLRTPGQDRTYISYVSRWGRTTYNFLSPVDHDESTIRPAIRVDIRKLKFAQLENGYYYVKEDKNYLQECKNGLDYKEQIQNALSNQEVRDALPLPTTDKQSLEQLSNPVFGGNEQGKWEGDRVYFGTYQKKPVLWRVLSTEDGKLMLLSEYGLEKMPFNEKGGEVEWESSSVRKWMNETLFNTLFTEEEQSVVETTHVVNVDNPRYGVDCGPDTEDKLYLLSWDECMNEAYGFTKGESENVAPTESNSRICYLADYKTEKAIYGKGDVNGNQIWVGKKSCSWLLRTAGFAKGYICDVDVYGDVYHHEQRKTKKKLWIRPVVVLDQNKIVLDRQKDAAYPTINVK